MDKVLARFPVSASHIRAGQRCHGGRCPIARAITARLLPHLRVVVSTRTVYVYEQRGYRTTNPGGMFRQFSLPDAVIAKIDDFDSKLGMDPFLFEMLFDTDLLVPIAGLDLYSVLGAIQTPPMEKGLLQ